MRKRKALIASLVTLLPVACSNVGSSAPAHHLPSPTASSAQSTSPTQTISQPPPEQSFSPPPEESTGSVSNRTTPSHHAGSGEPSTITVGGPTLYNDYPQIGQLDFDAPHDFHCGYFKNAGGETNGLPFRGYDPSPAVPVTITNMSMVDQTPAGSTAFSVTEPGCPDEVAATSSLKGASQVDSCIGATLPPWPGPNPLVCTFFINLDGTPGTNYTAKLQVSFSALCAAPTGIPCGYPAVARLHPSDSHKVTVRWSAIEADWQACLATNIQEGYAFGHCPAPQPPVSSTPTPSPKPSESLPAS